MDYEIDPDWRGRFIRTAHALSTAERTALARHARTGRLVRLARGIYREASAPRTADEAYRDLVYAHDLRTDGRRVFTNESAAVMWRLPNVGARPQAVHVADGPGGGHSSGSVVRHATGLPTAVVLIDGVRVTSLLETVVDLMRTRPLAGGLVAADAAIAGLDDARGAHASLVEIEHVLDARSGRGLVRARQVLALADGAAGSPGESVSRATMFRAGFPRPELQFRMVDRYGEMFGDFAWPEHGLVGEFDGVGKYLRHEWTNGRDAAQVVIDEKWREDRIRALGWRVARWSWDIARSPARLAAVLVDAGLPRPSAHVRSTWARKHALG